MQEQIVAGLTRYAIEGDGDVKPLIGRPGFRLRTGRYRVIFGEDAETILAIYWQARNDDLHAMI